jgi:hypothetical protein
VRNGRLDERDRPHGVDGEERVERRPVQRARVAEGHDARGDHEAVEPAERFSSPATHAAAEPASA